MTAIALGPVMIARVLVPFAVGYFLSYAFRAINAIIAADLSADTGLDAGALGLVTSAYFFTFAAFQLPLGVLLDRFGPRRVESVLLLVAALGALLFALGESAAWLAFARACIGLGVSGCLMASFKAFVMWFPGERLPLVNGCIMTAGALGALSVTTPTQWLLGYLGWREIFVALAVVTVLAAVLIFFVVPRHPDEVKTRAPGLRQQLEGVAAVYRNPFFWRIVPMVTATHAGFLAFQSLWAGPWLRDVDGLAGQPLANHLLAMATAMVVGYFTLGLVMERVGRFGLRAASVPIVGMGGFMLVQLAILAGLPVPSLWLWSAFGLFGTSTILWYALLSQRVAPEIAGRANTGMNVIAFGGAFAAQWGIGAIIGLWPGETAGSYALAGYRAGLGTSLALQAVGFVWLLAPRRDPAARL